MSTLPQFIVAQPDELGPCLEHLASTDVLGFDTEFVGEESYHPILCLVQVATAERLYLLDPLTCGSLDGFWRLLLDPRRTVVVHAGREEVRLCKHATGAVPPGLFDLQIGAGLVGRHFPLSHGALVQQILGVQLPKGETLTEWRTRPLTPNQIRYAYDDVRCLLASWQNLHSELESLGRLGWVREECERLALAATPDRTTNEKWLKLRGLGSLDRKKLAVVRALFQWRDARAAETNKPSRQVLRDDLIIELAKRGTVQVSDLQSVRGLAKRDLAVIAATIESARALPPEEWPEALGREQDPPQLLLLANLLNAVLSDLCLRRKLSSSLVATNADVRALVRARFDPTSAEESILTTGWRAEHLLPDLQAILDGRSVIRVADPTSESPLEVRPLS